MRQHKEYYIESRNEEFSFMNYVEARDKALEIILSQSEGSINFSAHDGDRPWWQKYIFGANSYIRSYFSVEWHNEIGGLIFHDENMSEYRSINKGLDVEPVESIRIRISFGESEPLPVQYCLEKETIVKALCEFLEQGQKPEWLNYEYVR